MVGSTMSFPARDCDGEPGFKHAISPWTYASNQAFRATGGFGSNSNSVGTANKTKHLIGIFLRTQPRYEPLIQVVNPLAGLTTLPNQWGPIRIRICILPISRRWSDCPVVSMELSESGNLLTLFGFLRILSMAWRGLSRL